MPDDELYDRASEIFDKEFDDIIELCRTEAPEPKEVPKFNWPVNYPLTTVAASAILR
jgi:hypothetical protein